MKKTTLATIGKSLDCIAKNTCKEDTDLLKKISETLIRIEKKLDVLSVELPNIFYENHSETEMVVSDTSYERFALTNGQKLVGENITIKLKIKSSNDTNRAYVSLANDTNTTQMLKHLEPIGTQWKDIEITANVNDIVCNTLIIATGTNYQPQTNGNNEGIVWVKDIIITINN